MHDYQRYQELMSEAQDALLQSESTLRRKDLPPAKCLELSNHFLQRAEELRREAMLIAKVEHLPEARFLHDADTTR